MESARTATVGDLGDLVQLAAEAIAELRPTRGGDLWALTAARATPFGVTFRHDLDDPDRLVVVGAVDDVVVGYGVVGLQVLADERHLGVIDELFTHPDARGVGIGEAMMDLLVDWCRARRCVGIDAVALPGNRATKNFFETFGLKARAIVVHRSFDEPGPASHGVQGGRT
jgi:ribosomal protein S18 acetylase RimI-like enzyme